MANLPEPSFIDRDAAQVTADLIKIYEDTTGKTLQPAQPERLFINLIAYREMLLRIAIQQGGLQNLVAFASDAMLDYLGPLVSCFRLPEQPARTTLRFTLIAIQDFDVPVAAGTGRGSKDNKFVFTTDKLLIIPAGQLYGDVTATADSPGIAGNGYLAGEVNVEIEPVAYVQNVANTSVTEGGANVEGPDHYRARIELAPEGFSTAGPEGAYIFWAKTAHPDIIDVKALNPGDATVNIYPLMSTGLPSDAILALVAGVLTAKKIRPLTDHVSVLVPTEVTFSIEVAVTLYSWVSDDDAAAIAAITKLLTDYTDGLRALLGQDLVEDQIKGTIRGYPGVYKSVLTLPAADRVLADNEWLNCTGIVVTIAGRVNG